MIANPVAKLAVTPKKQSVNKNRSSNRTAYFGGGCFDPFSKVLMYDKTYKLAKNIESGDIIMSYILDDKLNLIEKRNEVLMTLHVKKIESDKLWMVNYENILWISPKHGIFDINSKKWIVPKKYKNSNLYPKTQNHNISEPVDFILKYENNGTIINVNGLYLMTLGHGMNKRFPQLYHSIKGDHDKCIEYWKEKAPKTFPNCQMIVTDDSSYMYGEER